MKLNPGDPAVIVPLLRFGLILKAASSAPDSPLPIVPIVLENVLDRLERLERHGPLAEIADERARQDRKWGEQNHPDGTGGPDAEIVAGMLKALCQDAGLPDGAGDTWLKILAEEVGEAFDETEWPKLRAELVQVAAVVVAWIEAGDRRSP